MRALAAVAAVGFRLVVVAIGISACAGGVADDATSVGVFDGGSPTSLSGATSEGGSGDEKTDETGSAGVETGPDVGECENDDDCLVQDVGCYRNGTCVDGVCENPPKAAGEPCDDAEACTGPDVCDGSGTCLGPAMDCSAHQAQGTCTDGLCGDMECLPGFGNCNGDWADGCEVPLGAGERCVDGCDGDCVAGPNSTAICRGRTCERACTGLFVDCDGDLANGCEIPEAVPNTCSATGLDDAGCWTPYCGQSDSPDARNFGTWYCLECSNCHVPGNGMCQWCDHSVGHWYPADTCECGNYEDLACGG